MKTDTIRIEHTRRQPALHSALWQLSTLLLLTVTLAPSLTAPKRAEAQDLAFYDIGTPALTRVYIDPVNGNDGRTGASEAQALRTITEAWNRIPQTATLTTSGYELLLSPGVFTSAMVPNYWESKYGSRNAPIIIRASGGAGSTLIAANMNVFDVRYLYLLDLVVAPNPAGDAFHCERCDHLLIRGGAMNGGAAREAHETVKINQSQYVYIEGVDIGGSYENAIDFVAVQYGHILRNTIHAADDWCIYLKGGSAQFLIEGNRIFDCGTGGFTAGQGTGFEYMTSPWLHYEAYDLKFVNNVIHDTDGAAFGVNGGYNILLAHNTAYRVGTRSHLIEVVHGLRSCDGDNAACAVHNQLGGWGPASRQEEGEPIPNRNVFILNNVVYNPPGVRSSFAHFSIHGPRVPAASSNIPGSSYTDENLVIRGNVIWNGPGAGLDLGAGSDNDGCQAGNPTCSPAQLHAENAINTFEPLLAGPAARDFRPAPGSPLLSAVSVIAPDFTGTDSIPVPLAPLGNLSNLVARDRSGAARGTGSIPGAYASIDSSPFDPQIPGSPGSPGTPPDSGMQPPPPTQPSDAPPTVTEARLRSARIRAGSKVELTGKAIDNIGVTQVVAKVGSFYAVMPLKRGVYKGTVRIPRGTPPGLYLAEVIAIDTAGQLGSRIAGVLTVRR